VVSFGRRVFTCTTAFRTASKAATVTLGFGVADASADLIALFTSAPVRRTGTGVIWLVIPTIDSVASTLTRTSCAPRVRAKRRPALPRTSNRERRRGGSGSTEDP